MCLVSSAHCIPSFLTTLQDNSGRSVCHLSNTGVEGFNPTGSLLYSHCDVYRGHFSPRVHRPEPESDDLPSLAVRVMRRSLLLSVSFHGMALVDRGPLPLPCIKCRGIPRISF
jgi:hypothetical protein